MAVGCSFALGLGFILALELQISALAVLKVVAFVVCAFVGRFLGLAGVSSVGLKHVNGDFVAYRQCAMPNPANVRVWGLRAARSQAAKREMNVRRVVRTDGSRVAPELSTAVMIALSTPRSLAPPTTAGSSLI
jgi:hypothetical protein